MEKIFAKKFFAALILSLLVLSSCSFFKQDPQEAVNEGITNFSEVKRMSSRLNIQGTIRAPEPEKPRNLTFTLAADGKSDVRNKESPLADMKFSLSLKADEEVGSGELLFRAVDKKLYFSLSKLELAGMDEKDNEQFKNLLGMWWSLPMSEKNVFTEFSDYQTEIQKKLKDQQLFVNAQEEGEEEIEGMKTMKYRVQLDKTALQKFIVEIARSGGNALTQEEEMAIEDSLKDVEFGGAVWVGSDDALHRMKGSFSVSPKQGAASVFDIDYTAWDYDEEVVVAAPESSKEFNPILLFPLLGMFGDLTGGEEAETVPNEALGAGQVAPKTTK